MGEYSNLDSLYPMSGIPSPKRRATPNKKNRQRLKRTIFGRDNFTCQACFREFEKPKGWNGIQIVEGLTLGHVIPRAHGGGFTVDNLKAECYDCNHARGDTLWE